MSILNTKVIFASVVAIFATACVEDGEVEGAVEAASAEQVSGDPASADETRGAEIQNETELNRESKKTLE